MKTYVGPITWGHHDCTLALPREYDGAICAAVSMRPVATTTVATCSVVMPVETNNAYEGFLELVVDERVAERVDGTVDAAM